METEERILWFLKGHYLIFNSLHIYVLFFTVLQKLFIVSQFRKMYPRFFTYIYV